MKRLIVLGAAALLASCNNAEAPPANDVAADEVLPADENSAGADMAAAPMSLNQTTWEYQVDGKPMVTSVDASGNYITETGDGKHVDHGTVALKDGKDCFTSAMGEKQTNCYTTTPEVAIGASAPSTDDKGVTLDYKRVEYRALKMPG